MKINNILYLIVLFVITIPAYGQDTDKPYYSKQRIFERNGWANSENAAGLVFNRNLSFSDLCINYNNLSGSFRNYNAPQKQSDISANTYSYQQIGNVYLYGSFMYRLQDKGNMAWNYMLTPYSTAFPFADSVKGNQKAETYHLNGAIAYPITSKLILGCDSRR